jgi:hypothetical protein
MSEKSNDGSNPRYRCWSNLRLAGALIDVAIIAIIRNINY